MQTGMMFRTNLAENAGMLFVLPMPQQASFWMKNCPLPLSAAYIDPEGVILEIHDLQPHNTNSRRGRLGSRAVCAGDQPRVVRAAPCHPGHGGSHGARHVDGDVLPPTLNRTAGLEACQPGYLAQTRADRTDITSLCAKNRAWSWPGRSGSATGRAGPVKA